MNITVVGMGYVGLANALLFAQNNKVTALEILEERVEMINNRVSPLEDKEMIEFFANKELDLTATSNAEEAYKDAEIIFVAAPTDYDDETNSFDTDALESVLTDIKKYASEVTVVLKSTVPIGYTKGVREEFGLDIIFSPEFLREGKALYDNLHPSRIIVSNESPNSQKAADLLKQGAVDADTNVLLMNNTEAEAVKLFSNTYLALRISYFNELDTYAEVKGLDTQQIIEGVGLDPRIGGHYNNPSFGYGGYCLPKDSKQLSANFKDIPNELMGAIVKSNDTRKDHIASEILKREPKVVGVYRLTMKSNSDNFRQSAILGIIERLTAENVEVVVYEPTIAGDSFEGMNVIKDFDEFSNKVDVIIANRESEELHSVSDKVYTRDVFNNN
ncbi:nucleotide sugar dehydrogenase [Aerococcaceae bacterium DSM 111022]|nr:nucleotide sugar dehydrogenase [Aerococcaceae bacterium DSM 111022]